MITDDAQVIAGRINATNADQRAYTEPGEALNNRPCFLVAPPVIDWTRGTYTDPLKEWRLIALSSYPVGAAGYAALEEFEQLLAVVEAADLDVQRGEPTSYQFSTSERVACYVLTLT